MSEDLSSKSEEELNNIIKQVNEAKKIKAERLLDIIPKDKIDNLKGAFKRAFKKEKVEIMVPVTITIEAVNNQSVDAYITSPDWVAGLAMDPLSIFFDWPSDKLKEILDAEVEIKSKLDKARELIYSIEEEYDVDASELL